MAKSKTKTKVVERVVRNKPAKTRARARRPKVARANGAVTPFGPVSTIDSAPVSIGNTFGGTAPIVTPTPYGQRIQGRDYLLNVSATAATVTGWTLVAGSPISPVCMVASGLRGLMLSYAKYCVHGIAFHYITSATTGSAGSVVLYIGKDRSGPGLNTNGENFLPVVLSDPNTVISPIWKNCSAVYHPPPEWLPTDAFNSDGLHEQGPGEFFIYSRSASSAVPGYIIMDYDISFMDMQVNIKSLSLPAQRMKYTQMRFVDVVPVANQIATYDSASGVLLDGTTTSGPPSAVQIGDIYKCIANTDDGYLGAALLGLAFSVVVGVAGGAATLTAPSYVDGATFYAMYIGGNGFVLYPNYYCASTSSTPLIQNPAIVGATHSFIVFASLVGTVMGGLGQSNV